MARIAILGAGLAGLAAARVLAGEDVVVYESKSHAGGHASSFSFDGYIFDEGPHVSFTSDARIRDYFAASVKNRYYEHPSEANNYYRGLFLKHPVQTNLRNLPPETITRCLADFVRAQYEDSREIHNYSDWCYKQLGAAISETFTRLYTRKYWTRELEDLTTDWVSQRIYAPKLEEVLNGALGAKATGQHYYMSTFRYPAEGGFHAYSTLLADRAPVQYEKQAIELNLSHRRIVFADGTSAHYEYLISSLPVPELTDIIQDAPLIVKDAASKLACTSHYLVSVGINRPDISSAYWTYIYDQEIPFSRLSFPSKFSPSVAPEGCSSVQAEVVHSRFRPMGSPSEVTEKCLEALQKCGVVHSMSEINAVDSRDIKYANVIFDFDRIRSLATVHEYLASNGIQCCGRFGEWAYLWTDQSIISGEMVGNHIRMLLGLSEKRFDEGR